MGDPERVFGLTFSPLGVEAIADELATRLPEGDEAQLLLTVNLDNVIRIRESSEFRAAHDRARIITADGMPVYLYAWLRGVHLPGRVTGADLLPALMERLSPKKHRLFFMVSDEETSRRVRHLLEKKGFHNDCVAVIIPPYGFEKDTDYSSRLAADIKKLRTTHLIMGVGAPKSQIWLDAHRKEIGPCHALPFGSAANFMVGTASRAPRWMQYTGVEWLWRMFSEPRRLSRRYLIDSWGFFSAIRDDLRSARRMR